MRRVSLKHNDVGRYFDAVVQHYESSYAKLARYLGVPDSTIRDWRKGTYNFPLNVAQRFGNELGVRLEIKPANYKHITRYNTFLEE